MFNNMQHHVCRCSTPCIQHIFTMFFHCCIFLCLRLQWPDFTRASLMCCDEYDNRDVGVRAAPCSETCCGTCAAYKHLTFFLLLNKHCHSSIPRLAYLLSCPAEHDECIHSSKHGLTSQQHVWLLNMGGKLSAPVASLLSTWTVWR